MAKYSCPNKENGVFSIPHDGGEHIITGYNQNHRIEIGNGFGNEYVSTSFDNGSLCINFDKNGVMTTIVLKDYYRKSPETVINDINGKFIYDFNDPNENRMTIMWDEKSSFINEEIIGDNRGNTINTRGGFDSVIAGGGNDKIYINGPNKGTEMIFNIGDGADKIYNATKKDSLVFNGIEFESLYFKKSGNDLVIKNNYCKTDSVTLVNYFKQKPEDVLVSINGKNILEEQVIFEITGKGKIYGTLFDDIITGSIKNDIIYASGGADDVEAGAGNDTIYTSTGGTYVDGGAGNDIIYVKPVSETGEERLLENIIYFEKGSGNDTIYGGASTDYIEISGYRREELTFTKSGNNLVIKGSYKTPVKDKMVTKSDSLTLVNWFTANDRIDNIIFDYDYENTFNINSEGNYISFKGTSKKDTLNANTDANLEINTGKGDDIITIGGKGEKILNCIVGEGNKTIKVNPISFNGKLHLNFEEDKNYELSYYRDGNNLVIVQNSNQNPDTYDLSKIQKYTIEGFGGIDFEENECSITLSYFNKEGSYISEENVEMFMVYASQTYFSNGYDDLIISTNEFNTDILIYGSNKNDEIDTTQVSDRGVTIITGNKGKTDIKTGDYSDTVVVSNLAGSLTNITDLGGDEDAMEIYGIKKGDGISVIFDVAKTGSEAETHKDIILMTSSGVKKFFLSKNDPSAGVVIKNWFVSHEDDCGKFETIDIDNVTTLIDEHIDIITKRVQAWLDDSKKNKKGHLTAMDVLERGTAAERNSLMAVYASENLGLELVENNLKNSTYNGTSGNDVLSAYNDDIILNGGKGNDKLSTAVYEDAGNVLYSGDYTTLNGGDGNDVLMGGFGSKFNGGKGNNVIHLRASGETTFISGGGADYIHFSDGTIGDLTFEKMGNDLYISSGSSFINVKDYFKNPAKSSLKGIAFSDTEVDYKYDTATEIVNTVEKNSINITKALQISEGLSVTSHDETFVTVKGSDINGVKDVFVNYEGVNEKFYGYKGENYFEFTDNSGHDTIYSGKGSDTIYFSEVSRPDDLFLSRQGNNLIIRSITRDGSGEILEINSNSSLTIADYYKLKGKTSISEVKFGSSDETFSLSDIVKIATEIGNFANNVTKNVSISNADEEASLIGNDTIKGSVGRDRLYAGIGNDIIYTGHGDDEIYGGKGNDIFYGQGGVNTYHFRVNDGNDVIYAGKNDTTIIDFQQEESIQFSEKGVSLTNDVNGWGWLPAFYKNGNDLVIYYSPSTNNNNNITLKDYFKSKAKFYIKDCVNEELLDLKSVLVYIEDNGTKVNGTSQDDCIGYSMEDRVNRTISSGAGDDIIYTGSGNSIIKAGDGDDEIYVNGGNNKIYGEGSIEGNRIYLSNVWENNTTTIYTGKGNDILVFEDVAYEDLDFSRSGNDMIITRYYGSEYDDGGKLIVDYTNKVLLIDYFKVNHSVKEIQTSEEGELVTTNLLDETELVEPYRANPDKKANITGSMLKDVIYGTVFNDTINGASNDDTLYGDAGNDTLYGGTGNDVIYGGDGSDIIKAGGNTGSAKEPNDNYCDKIYGGSGNDKIYTESGYNRIYLSSGHGDDIIYMGKGRDDIYFDSTVEMNSLNYRGSGNNLVISYGQADENGKQSSITIVNYFTSSYKSVKSLIFESKSCNGYDLEDYIIQGIRDKREGVSCNAYDGTADSNFIYLNSTSKKIIDCAYGSSYYIGEFWENVNDNDIIQSNSKLAYLEGGYGNDTYIVNSLSNTTEINDVQGTDTIILNENKSNVNFIFNVYKEGCAPEPDPGYDDFMNWGMFIMNDSSLNKMLKTKMRANVPNTSIYDFFNQRGETPYNYNIETIQTKDGETVTSADLFAVKEAIASWLETKGKYDSAIEVLERGSSKDVNKLLQFYAAAWDTSKLEGLLQ